LTAITGSTPAVIARRIAGGISRRYLNPKTARTPNNPNIAPEAPTDGGSKGFCRNIWPK
jgi:hypothetical protein